MTEAAGATGGDASERTANTAGDAQIIPPLIPLGSSTFGDCANAA